MANETELSNIAHKTDEISDAISGALVQSVVVLPLIFTEDLPMGTNIKLFRKDGNLVAEGLAESTAYTFGSNSELTQTTVTATATKFVCASKLTVESQQFSTMTPAQIAQKQGEALARDLDDEILALFSSFSNQITATDVLTVDDVLDGAFTVDSNLAGGTGALVGVFDYKGINELRKELIASGAAVFSQRNQTSLLEGIKAGNGFSGTLPGVDLYTSNGLPTSGGDDVALVFNPNNAIAGMVSPSVNVIVNEKGSEGFYTEIASYVFFDAVEWNDVAGAGVLSDT